MRRILTLCLLLLSAAGLTGVAYADAILSPVQLIVLTWQQDLPVFLVILALVLTFLVLVWIGRKK